MEYQYNFFWQSGLFLLAFFVFFFLAKLVFKLFNLSISTRDELINKDNIAFYISYLSYFLAIVMVIGGVMNSEGSGDFWNELYLCGVYGLVGIVILNISSILMDKVFHLKISFWDEIIKNKSISIGILKGGNYLSTGIIIGGIMLTEVDRPLEAIGFLIIALLIASFAFIYYNLIMSFSVKGEIYNGNIAVALSTFGVQIAFAILIHSAFQIEHTTWQESFINIGVDVLGGIIILPIIRFIVDKLFLPKRNMTDEMINQDVPNLGLGLFEATAYIGGALLFVWCWNL